MRIAIRAVVLFAVLAAGGWWGLRERSSLIANPASRPTGGGEPFSAGLVPASSPERLQGRLLGPDGGAAAGASVELTRFPAAPADAGACLSCTDDCAEPPGECDCLASVRLRLDRVTRHEGEAQLIARTATGEDGTFAFEAPGDGVLSLWATHPTLGAAVVTGLRKGANARLALKPYRVLHGTVKHGRIEVPGARVVAMLEDLGRAIETVADENGDYTFGPVVDASWKVIADAPGLIPELQLLNDENWFEQPPLGLPLELSVPFAVVAHVSREGRPATGIQVTMSGDHLRRETRSGADGIARFEGLRRGEYELEARALPLVARVAVEGILRMGEGELDVQLPLEDGTELSVSVVDSKHAPVADADLRLSWAATDLRLAGTTDAHGVARFGWVPGGPLLLSVEADGFGAVSNEAHTAVAGRETRWRTTLAPGAVVAGRVLDEAGQPCDEASVTATSLGEDPAPADSSVAWPAGEFRFASLTPGRWRITAQRGDGLPTSVEVTAPATELVLRLDPGATLDFAVTEADGTPVAGAEVKACSDFLGDDAPTFEVHREGRTDVEGELALTALAPGHYRTSVVTGEPRPRLLEAELVVTRPGTALKLVFPAGHRIAGRVVDFDGTPVRGATVRAQARGKVEGHAAQVPAFEMSRAAPAAATADASGHFRFSGLERGAWGLTATRGAGGEFAPSVTTEVETGELEVLLTLPRSARAKGRLVDEAGGALDEFTFDGATYLTTKGSFLVSVQATDAAAPLVFRAPGFGPTVLDASLKPGQTTDLGEVVLRHGRTAQVNVRSLVGDQPVNNAAVFIISNDIWTGWRESSRSITTDSDGHVELRDVDRDEVSLVVRHDGYVERRVPLARGQGVVRVALDPAARLTGSVRGPDGQLVRATQARVRLTCPAGHPEETFTYDGHFTFGSLPPGTCEVSASWGQSDVGPLRAALHAGKTTEVTLGGPPADAVVRVPSSPATGSLFGVWLGSSERQAPKSQEELRELESDGLTARMEGGGPGWVLREVPPGSYLLCAARVGGENELSLFCATVDLGKGEQTWQPPASARWKTLRRRGP